MPLDFEFLEHTADTRFLARGATLDAVFVHAAEALFAAMYPWDDLQRLPPTRTLPPITVTGDDLEALLVNWLGELLWRWEVERFVPTGIKVILRNEPNSGSPGALTGEVAGVSWGEAPERIGPGVKAVTHQDIRFEHTAAGWQVAVTLDI